MGYYDKTTSSHSYYSSPSDERRSEPDMRTELENTLDGNYPEIKKGHYSLLRKATLGSNGKPISCPCVDETSKEQDKNNFCSICYGEGNYWTETYIKTYRTIEASNQTNAFLNELLPAGKMNIPSNIFYFRYSDEITTYDKIIEIELDTAGEIVYPVNRLEVYSINFAWCYRLDYGRREYWKVFTHREHTKFLNEPSYEGDL